MRAYVRFAGWFLWYAMSSNPNSRQEGLHRVMVEFSTSYNDIAQMSQHS